MAKATTKRDWRPPHPNRVRAIRARLRRAYGVPAPKPHGDPVAELVLTVLSQNTNDRNRDVAYVRLVNRFPTWDEVAAAPVQQIEEEIAPGGISKVKSRRIKQILAQVADDHGHIDLSWLADAPLDEARDYLCTLPGVARKTAACVLLFAYGRPDIPVDTHVGRVGQRLGLFREKASFEEMHNTMLAITPPELAHEAHVNLIRHGRRVCHSRSPQCPVCPLRDICPARQRFT
jgi:endonuclease-3